MNLEDFCRWIGGVNGLTNPQKAAALLWHFDQEEPGCQKSAGELARVIKDHRIGSPNSTGLDKQLRGSRWTYVSKGRFRLRQDKKAEVRSRFEHVLTGVLTEVPVNAQFLSEQVWRPTRGYLEKVCIQLNGSFHEGFYDCAAVMIRRVIETLIIEAYESISRESEIKHSDGNYFMLGKLVEAANGNGGLSLGREAKTGLEEIKKLGDRSAHNRRYNAKKPDLDKVQDSLRIAFEELANLAGLYGQ